MAFLYRFRPISSICFDGIHFPTVFSPDGVGDGLNEQYAIRVGNDVKEFVFRIYDRWGNTMFESS